MIVFTCAIHSVCVCQCVFGIKTFLYLFASDVVRSFCADECLLFFLCRFSLLEVPLLHTLVCHANSLSLVCFPLLG